MKRSPCNNLYSVLCHLLSQKSLNNVIYSLKTKQNKRETPALTWFATGEENRFQPAAYERKHSEPFITSFTIHTDASCQNWPVKYLHRLSKRD